MSQPFVSEIRMFSFDFPPRGWATCSGQILAIQQNTALFSLLGTTYGGNGTTTFCLPDLRGRMPVHHGQGPGLMPYSLGEVGGSEAVTVLANQMPVHTHTPMGINIEGNAGTPGGNVWASAAWSPYAAGTPTNPMNGSAIGNVGGGQPHPNLPPQLTLNFAIALQGIFPSRN